MSHRKIDEVTGVETTGHVWDGDISELNKPLPRWWLYTFYVSIVWAIGYWVVYPAWPTINGYTKGVLNYSQRDQVQQDIEAWKSGHAKYRSQIAEMSLADIRKNDELFQFSIAGGAALFGENCAGCHGRGAQGGIGYPNLNDDDWLWGGDLEKIHQTIAFGVRSGNPKAHDTAMPRFGVDKILDEAQIRDAANFVRSFSHLDVDQEAAKRGAQIFADNCAACHGDHGKGNQEMGAPNLTDAIWLYGNSQDAVMQSIRTGRGGAMPAWSERLDPVAVKMLTLYVYSLGGAQAEAASASAPAAGTDKPK
ncbi:cytochrome-c oxidase, cbb3-type subunit III [Hyphomicrobium sp.]|uniref:cytochrome-c oxidase, cbb3-type subunit III n=1 Tax=Hyphomicrobium sp. TaxID=82 RepID=UPI000F9B6119|nr:cytochrome-c oxidase, cbb3-type subunit III [Hyphomicrobium sp.]RUP09166.1 MAG: cytochrome-c oxidase, cbb3-type subunit III [Hyphomicrobium sp.]